METEKLKKQKVENKGSLQKTAIILVSILALLFIFLFFKSKSKVENIEAQLKIYEEQNQERDSIMNEMEGLFDEVMSNISYVQEKRGNLYVESNERNEIDARKTIVDNVKLMDQMLYDSQARIEELELKLKSSSSNNASYKKRIATLNKMLKNQKDEIESLKLIIDNQDFKIADFMNKLTEMSDKFLVQEQTISEQENKLNQKDSDLNTVYIAYGTRKDLKAQGLISNDDKVLGLRIGSNTVSKDINNDNFIKIDIRDTKVIPLTPATKKAKLISSHPDASYELMEDAEGNISGLRITNSNEFWKLTRYAVIQTR